MILIYIVITVVCELARRVAKGRHPQANAPKLMKMLPKLCTAGVIVGTWLLVSDVFQLIFGKGAEGHLSVELAPQRTMLLGLSISNTVITTWVAMALLLAIALVVRVVLVPRFTMVPGRAQSAIEAMVGGIDSYAKSKAHGLGENLSAYLFTVAMLMVGCAAVELMGVRAPTSDITMTFALALITFVLINYYGIKKKGALGRVKALNAQGPIVMVLRVISDIAIPVSMACRLFGNMLGGMIVMELIYNSLGHRAIAVPSVLGLYFNVFHPLIQAFIFITLTLTFIDEAIE